MAKQRHGERYAEMGVDEYITFEPRPRKGMELKGYRRADLLARMPGESPA